MTNILAGLVSLLEGSSGESANCIQPGQFKYTSSPVEELKLRSSGRPLPFNIRDISLAVGSQELGDMTAASKMRGAHGIEIHIAYSSRPHDDLTLMGIIADDETALRSVLEYEPNIALTSGWTGCSITGTAVQDVDGEEDNAPPKLRVLVLSLSVSHRDTRIT